MKKSTENDLNTCSADPGAVTESNALLDAQRGGFSLVEVIVAMVMLAVVVSSLAMLSAATAQRAIGLANEAGQQGIALSELNRAAAMSYDTIPQMANGCDTVNLSATNTALRYRRCLSFTQGTRFREITVRVTALKAGIFPDTTLVVRRVAATTVNPLFTP